MNRDRCVGNWKQLSGMLKEQWALLIHDNSGVEAGKQTQLAGRIQERRGISNEESARQVRDFYYRNRDWHSI